MTNCAANESAHIRRKTSSLTKLRPYGETVMSETFNTFTKESTKFLASSRVLLDIMSWSDMDHGFESHREPKHYLLQILCAHSARQSDVLEHFFIRQIGRERTGQDNTGLRHWSSQAMERQPMKPTKTWSTGLKAVVWRRNANCTRRIELEFG
jgi:hypothetical protein